MWLTFGYLVIKNSHCDHIWKYCLSKCNYSLPRHCSEAKISGVVLKVVKIILFQKGVTINYQKIVAIHKTEVLY